MLKKKLKMTLMAGAGLSLALTSQAVLAQQYDYILDNGTVVDGSGVAGYVADVAIKDGKIAAIAKEIDLSKAANVVDAAGQVVAPGFVDLHSHVDRDALDNAGLENNLFQGITTALAGNCGGSPLDVADFAEATKRKGLGHNVGLLIGHNTVRRAVMGNVDKAPSDAEQQEMEGLVAKAMNDGAFGLSTGLKYLPGTFADTNEVIALAKVSAQHGGIYTSHMREEGADLLKSVAETINIGDKAGLPAHISHHKTVGKPNWGQSVESLKMVDDARAKGLDVTLDQYPYTASSTTLTILVPSWAMEGTREDVRARLDDPETRARVKAGIIDNIRKDRGGDDPARVYVSSFPADTSLNGKNLAEISLQRGRTTSVEDGAETLMELVYEGGGRGVFHAMHEDDVKRIMQHPYVAVATDGFGPTFGENTPHPRNYGTYTRVLGHYSRELGVLTLEEAIRKMTSLPASRMGLKDRGLVQQGLVADLVVFDPETVAEVATFEDPHQYSVGFSYVFVNGKAVIAEGKRTSEMGGEFLNSNHQSD